MEPANPKSLRSALRLLKYQALNYLVEYGGATAFLIASAVAEALRRQLGIEGYGKLAFYIFEGVSLLTMVVPKAIRLLGDLAEAVAVAVRNVQVAWKTGERAKEPPHPKQRKEGV